MQGWIKTHRALIEWEWYTAPNHLHLFIHLLLKANHKEGNFRGIPVKRGELLTSLSKLEHDTGISKQGIRTVFKNLKKTGEINTIPNTKLTHITICNYDSYQQTEEEANTQSNTQLTHDQHTPNTRLTTNKNNNNNKNDKNEKKSFNAYACELPEYIDRGAFNDWLKKRTKLKCSNGERAINRILNDLQKAYSNGENCNNLIHDSIDNGWKKIVPMSDRGGFSSNKPSNERAVISGQGSPDHIDFRETMNTLEF